MDRQGALIQLLNGKLLRAKTKHARSVDFRLNFSNRTTERKRVGGIAIKIYAQ